MKFTLSALSAVLVLTALSVPAAADMRFLPGDGGDVVVGDRNGGFDAPFDRSGWRGDDGRFGDRDGRGWDQRGRRDDILPERRIVRRVLREGFVRIDDIELRRGRYLVRAIRPNGALVRLAIDAYDGEILGRERIGWTVDGRRYERDRFNDGRPVLYGN